MIIYLLIFSISIVFTVFSSAALNRHKNFGLFLFLSSFVILAPTLLATFRDPGIGTDTLGYVQDVWSQMLRLGSFSNIWYAYNNGYFYDFENVYLLINCIAFIFGEDIHWLYFFVSLSIMLPIYIAIYDNRKNAPMWLGVTLFLLLYYNYSLNMIRQSIALAFCIYSFKFIERCQWIKAIIWFFIIINTHNTGIFYGMFICVYLITQIRNGRLKNILFFVVNLFLITFFVAFDFILIYTVSLGLLSDKYLIYLSDAKDADIDLTTTIGYIVLLMVCCLSLLIVKKRGTLSYQQSNIYVKNKLIGTFLFCTALISKWAFRISFYFNYPIDCLLIPRILTMVKIKSRFIYQLLLWVTIGFCVLVWYWTTVVTGVNSVYPYKSEILGI